MLWGWRKTGKKWNYMRLLASKASIPVSVSDTSVSGSKNDKKNCEFLIRCNSNCNKRKKAWLWCWGKKLWEGLVISHDWTRTMWSPAPDSIFAQQSQNWKSTQMQKELRRLRPSWRWYWWNVNGTCNGPYTVGHGKVSNPPHWFYYSLRVIVGPSRL